MKLTAAVVTGADHRFVVVLVKDHVLHHPTLRSELLGFARQEFRVPAALMSIRTHQTFGPRALNDRIRRMSYEELPWREYSFAR